MDVQYEYRKGAFRSLVLHVLIHTLEDSLKLLPFLFAAYLLIELIEHKAEEKTVALVHRAGAWGPVAGSLLGVIPQCGFSAATANLYAGGVITRGTLLAVFLSTSDEMLPILLSHSVPGGFILKILAFKALAGMAAGILVDAVERRFFPGREISIGEMCRKEGCRCEEGILPSALRHTLKIFLFLLGITLAVNLAVELVGDDRLTGFILNRPVVGELLAGLIGLIPNCAASVVLTTLYLEGGMSAGAMLSGLLAGSGVGYLVLARMNRHAKDNLITLGLLYAFGVFFGLLAGLLPIF